MPIFDPSQGGSPQLNQPVIIAYNGFPTPVVETWKGDLPYGSQLISAQEGVQALQSLDPKYYSNKDQLLSTFQSTLTNLPQSNYVIGPNGNLMTKEAATNFMPSPEEAARGIKPTGTYATGSYTTLASGAIVPKDSPAVATSGTLPQAPTGTLAGATFSSNLQPPTVNLQPGATGAEVKKLQDYLVSIGYMTQAQVDTGYGNYGPQTTAAVAALQKSLGVDNSGAVGYFGPKTMAAITSSGGTGSTGGTTGGTGGTTGTNNEDAANAELQKILNNPNLTADQKAVISSIYGAVKTHDADTAKKIQDALAAATKYSDPYFKAQVRLATDALSRGLSSKEGDLAFAERQKQAALEDLRATTAAQKDKMSFDHQQELQQLATKYDTDLNNTRDNLAASGFTESSRRARSEQILNENNTGLVESSNKNFSYQTGNIDRALASGEASTAAEIANLQRLTAEGKLDLLRTGEQSVGTDNLASLGYTGLLGGVGGEIPRSQAQDAFSFASNFVF